MRKFLLLAVLLLGAAVAAWRFGGLGGASQKSPQSAGRQAGGGAINVVVAPVEQVNLPIRRRSFGWVEPEQIVAVRSRVATQLLQQHFQEGQMVKKGELLFTLDDRELAAQVAKDQATLDKDIALQARAEADLSRNQQLVARNAGTQQALDLAVADAKSAAATVVADRAALDADKTRLSYTKIYAPITGRAGSVGVTPGNLVSTSDTATPLVTITSMDPIRISFTLPERELAQLQAAMSKPGGAAVRALDEDRVMATGKLTFIDSSVDPSTGTITVKARFQNADMKLWPGRYTDVELDTTVHDNALVAPAIAVQQGQNGPYVFVATDQNVAQLRNVKTGVTSGDKIEVLEGLAASDRVVTEGQLRLSNGAKVIVTSAPQTQKLSAAQSEHAPATRKD